MVSPHPRAISAEDKEERRQAILDAALRVLLAEPDRLASVEEVAAAAGLAKGTVYLYFPSKEAILLALHETQVCAFFRELIERAAEPTPVTIESMSALVRRHMVDAKTFLPIAAICFGWQEQGIPAATMLDLKLTVARMMDASSSALAPHFPGLDPGQIHELLLQSYGLIIGLWQLLRPMNRIPGADAHPELARLQPDYLDALNAALRALWLGRMAIPPGDGARAPGGPDAPPAQETHDR